MKIIDFHTHFFPNKLMDALWRWFETHAWPIQYKHYADELVQVLKSNGIARCVSLHYPHKPEMAESLNEWAYQLGEKYKDFIIPFGSVHPDDENKEKILKTCFEKFEFKGLKIHCHVQHVAPDDPRMEVVYKMCETYKKIMLIHCGTAPHFKGVSPNPYGYDVTTVSGLKRFEKTLKKFPNVTFVVPHLGFEETEGFFNLLPDYPNLFLDTAMALTHYFSWEVKKESMENYADRILFGSDFPNIPYEWEREYKGVLQFKLDTQKEKKIFYENAARLLKMKEKEK
jgi:predicted TIM-barrel fold metal-dependent hydrolase